MQQLPQKDAVRTMERLEEVNISSTVLSELINREIKKRREALKTSEENAKKADDGGGADGGPTGLQ